MGSSQSSPRDSRQDRSDRRRGLQRTASEVLRRARITTSIRETRSSRNVFEADIGGGFPPAEEPPLEAPPLVDDSRSASLNDDADYSDSLAHEEAEEEAGQESNEEKEREDLYDTSIMPSTGRRNPRSGRMGMNNVMDIEDARNNTERSVSFDHVQLQAVGENQPLTPPHQNIRSITMDSISPMGVPPVMMMTDSASHLDEYNNSYSMNTSEDPVLFMASTGRYASMNTDYSGSSISDGEDEELYEFYPPVSSNYEWMGRSVESLVLGHIANAPMLRLLEDDIDDRSEDEWSSGYVAFRRRSTASTFGGDLRRRGSVGSYAGSRRGSLSLNTGAPMHGGTMANYFNRRRQMHPQDVDRSSDRPGRRGSTTFGGPVYRRRSTTSTVSTHYGNINDNMNSTAVENIDHSHGGPNVVLSLMARELTGKPTSRRGTSSLQCLRSIGGTTLYGAVDRPAGGMATELAFLSAAIDTGDWTETQTIVSRLAPRLIGDPSAIGGPGSDGAASAIEDPSLPPSASPFYAGGGRLGLERDAFVLAGGVKVLMRIFREKSFVGQEMAQTYDARDLGEGLVGTRLAPCWNEALASLRELIFAIPSLVEDGTILDNGEFLPFLFTLLSHDSCFDGAAALIEEILSLMTHSPQQAAEGDGMSSSPQLGRVPPVTTFFLGNVPDLYKLWRGFNCRQLAHFCRILALLVFEPEDRQLLESPAVLKSSELLQLRRNRALRAGRDSTVDMNQAILLGDIELARRLLMLLRVMNFAPSTRRSSPYHVMAHFPFIADTLIMLGLNELDSWDEIERLEKLARKLLTPDEDAESSEHDDEHEELFVSELGSVADMLENLSTTLLANQSEPTNQLSHIIHVISAAQQAGVVVDRSRQGRSRRRRATGRSNDRWQENSAEDNNTENNDENDMADPNDGIQGLTSAASMLTDQVLVRRLYASVGQDPEDSPGMQVVGIGVDRHGGEDGEGGTSGRPRIANPQDAANSLQFNALLLGPYQVEVLFVLCTLLGGRRKIDAQEQLNLCGVIPVLDDMFQRLPWHISRRRESATNGNGEQSNGDGSSEDQPGIHGPGCECTPESALCVQYLRLLHNFCDRDCDNYAGRRNLLSKSEKAFVLNGSNSDSKKAEPGLLSKIVGAFTRESDESPYRFWLASCIESYLRGSSPAEQVFVARSGLLDHLIEDVTSERLHCAGSLQTSFDLLGELCKGNHKVLCLLVEDLDEESFRKLMSVAAANLVDSNVFIRSLWLSLERMSAANGQVPLHIDRSMGYTGELDWVSQCGTSTRSYLTHSWWDTVAIDLVDEDDVEDEKEDDMRSSDWFPTIETIDSSGINVGETSTIPAVSGLNESVGHFGWVFSPVGNVLSASTFEPNTMERLSWFLAANRARLLRDLLGVVDLRNINHENICCLNTAVVIAIFAHRRKELSPLLLELRQMNDEEKETKRRATDAAAANDDFVDRAFVQAMRLLDIDQDTPSSTPSYSRRASLRASLANVQIGTRIGDRTDVMRNFREVLWFWFEYYTHRGRDRLSLEFSSHLRFQEWMQVVSHLVADDGAPTSLVRTPVRLPRSPYQSAARITESVLRAE